MVVVAVLLSRHWGGGGLNPVYPILILVIIALAFEGMREWLSRATKVKLPGGIEVTRAVEDAVAALASLRTELDDRMTWLAMELYGSRKRSTLATIERLRADGLIRPYEARLAKAVRDASGKFIAAEIDRGGDRGEAATRFVERADKLIHQIRLIAFDALIRKGLAERGLRIIDLEGQPDRRWPDFYAFDPDRTGDSPETLRVSVRMARNKTSDLIDGARKRLRDKWPETPLDTERVKRVIVFPQTSKTRPPEDDEIPALRRDAFFAWVDAWKQ